ncbi:hypothetical protein FRC0192_02084 [Corynebacterium diphtheriae]|nr:hypothetical protein FRC0192_02084 [Corynebacterium diphtheriae]
MVLSPAGLSTIFFMSSCAVQIGVQVICTEMKVVNLLRLFFIY